MSDVRGDDDAALDRPGRPPTPLSRRERERILRAPTAGLDGAPPDRRPVLALVAAIAILAVAGMFGLAALSGDGDMAAPATTIDDAAAEDTDGSSSEGEGSGDSDGDGETGGDGTATTAPAAPTSVPPPPSRPTTTVPSTAAAAPLGSALQANLADGVVSVEGDVPSAEDAAVIVAVLETVAGTGNVDSALVVDPEASTPAGVSLVVGDSVSFTIGSSAIESGFLPVLDRMAELMAQDPNISIVVKGHTDGTGDPVRNLALSQERAENVVDYIADQGINRFRLEPRGRGSTEPVGDDATAEGQAQNRRIEFVLLGLGLGPTT